MFIIEKSNSSEIVIKNSRFITILLKINTKDDLSKLLDEIKNQYPKATHYCYAYIINDYKKASDDGEPGGTAGMPILNILEKEKIMNVLAVVVRYFGGIKLGTGGLTRAYSKCVKETLNKTSLLELENGKKIKLTLNYNQEKNVNYLLRTSEIISKNYQETITYEVLVNNDTLNNLIKSNIKFTILGENIYIKKQI